MGEILYFDMENHADNRSRRIAHIGRQQPAASILTMNTTPITAPGHTEIL